MAATTAPQHHLPSLTAITFRRGLQAGRLNLGIAVVVSLVLTASLLGSVHGALAFQTTFPLEIPLFAAIGSLGGLLVFVGDRSKGVLEYLISYGIRPGSLFANYVVATAGLASLVLSASLAVGLGGYLAEGYALTWTLEESVLGYTIPMTFASALFASTTGMIWSALSSPRAGMNSPVGLAPMLGVAPPLIMLIVGESLAKSQYYYVTVGVAAAFLVLVGVLLAVSSRLMRRERYLSAM